MLEFIDVKKFWEELEPFYCIDSIPSLPYPNEDMPWSWIVERLISCGAIPKKDLVPGKKYIGSCRNAHIAEWDGKQFIYLRTKFYDTFEEEINHFEDDDGYDLFVPVWEYEPKELNVSNTCHWIEKEFGVSLISFPLDQFNSTSDIEDWAKETYGKSYIRLGLKEYLERKEK